MGLRDSFRAINQIVDIYWCLQFYLETFAGLQFWTEKLPFICVPLSPEYQELFAFEWDDPETNMKQQ